MELDSFDADFANHQFDREAFLFPHKLLGHPALSLQNLAHAIPRLPPDQVYHSNGKLTNTDNFDRAHIDHKPELGLEATLDQLRTANAYIMVRKPETDPSFKPLLDELRSDVARMVAAAGVIGTIEDAMLYLFIASPNSITPFHIDRYSTFLMQFQGNKEVTVYPPWDQRVVGDEDVEHFFANTGRRPVWRPESESLAQCFNFSPGQTLHIPFAAGHHVRNGSDDVSISLSIIFNTAQTRQLKRALVLNHYLRRGLGRIGMRPKRVAIAAYGESTVSPLWRAADWTLKRVRKGSG